MEMIKKAHEQVVILTSAHRDLIANVREVSDDDANDHDRSFVEGLALSCCSVLQCVAVRFTHCNMIMRMITIALLLKVLLYLALSLALCLSPALSLAQQ